MRDPTTSARRPSEIVARSDVGLHRTSRGLRVLRRWNKCFRRQLEKHEDTMPVEITNVRTRWTIANRSPTSLVALCRGRSRNKRRDTVKIDM